MPVIVSELVLAVKSFMPVFSVIRHFFTAVPEKELEN